MRPGPQKSIVAALFDLGLLILRQNHGNDQAGRSSPLEDDCYKSSVPTAI